MINLNICLINPAMRPDSPRKLFPMGLGYIATTLFEAGIEFSILDIDAHRHSDEEVERFIRQNKFDIFAYGCIVTNYRWVKRISSLIKSYHPNATIIVGNSVSTSIPELLLEKTKADIAVVGEGDMTIIELVKALDNKTSLDEVKGIYFKQDGVIRQTPAREIIGNLDDIPFVNRDLFDIGAYIEASRYNIGEPYPLPIGQIRALNINTSRGCVLHCSFCFHNFLGKGFRWRSPVSVVAEMKMLNDKYGINHFSFWDDLSFANRKQFKAFADELEASKLEVYWTAVTIGGTLREGDDALARKLKDLGLISVGFALESASEPILKMMHKPLDLKRFSTSRNIFQSAGIPVLSSLVFGYPIETPETIRETVDFCIKEGLVPSSGFVLPLPGTWIYDWALENGKIRPEEQEDYLLRVCDRQDLSINLTNMSNEDLLRHVQEGVKRYQLSQGVQIEGSNPLKTGNARAAQLGKTN